MVGFEQSSLERILLLAGSEAGSDCHTLYLWAFGRVPDVKSSYKNPFGTTKMRGLTRMFNHFEGTWS